MVSKGVKQLLSLLSSSDRVEGCSIGAHFLRKGFVDPLIGGCIKELSLQCRRMEEEAVVTLGLRYSTSTSNEASTAGENSSSRPSHQPGGCSLADDAGGEGLIRCRPLVLFVGGWEPRKLNIDACLIASKKTKSDTNSSPQKALLQEPRRTLP